MWLLVYVRMAGTLSEKVAELWENIREHYEVGDCKIGDFTLTTFCDPKRPWQEFPHLKAKGAETKDLVKCLYACWKKYRINDNTHAGYEYDSQVEALLADLLAMGNILDEFPVNFSSLVPLQDALRRRCRDSFCGMRGWRRNRTSRACSCFHPKRSCIICGTLAIGRATLIPEGMRAGTTNRSWHS